MGALGTTTISFGTTPTDETSGAVTDQAGIVAGSHVEAWFMRDEIPGENGFDEHMEAAAVVPLVCGSIIAGTGFTIYAKSIGALVIGDFTVHWGWS